MKTRSFGDLMIAVLAYVSLAGIAALIADGPQRRGSAERRLSLPSKRRFRMRTIEDSCRHCKGSGYCEACMPASCRVCRGSGLQPRDRALVAKLDRLWNGAP